MQGKNNTGGQSPRVEGSLVLLENDLEECLCQNMKD